MYATTLVCSWTFSKQNTRDKLSHLFFRDIYIYIYMYTSNVFFYSMYNHFCFFANSI